MMKTYPLEYRVFFYILWFIIYIIYPSWVLPISTVGRFLVFSGLIFHFLVSAYLLNFCLKGFSINNHFPTTSKRFTLFIREHLLLFIICGIAVILHIYPLTFPILISGDEAAHLHGGLGIYMFLNRHWQNIFDFPIQYASWTIGILTLSLIKHQRVRAFLKRFIQSFSTVLKNPLFILIILFLLFAYFFALRNLSFHQLLTRYPPVAKILYLLSYLLTGITPLGPRILQVGFYTGGALYLYRTINLFRDRETALLGASIYLFSPLVFHFASFAELASGVVFFIIITSFYFLRFLRNNNDKDMILTSLLLSIGFFYKRDILLMIFVCLAYLLYSKRYKRWSYLNILMLSLVPIAPWVIISGFFSLRNYEFTWSHLISPETLSSYFLMIPSQVSWVIFFIFIISIISFLIRRKDHLHLFFAFIFISYYLFYVADITVKVHRFSTVFYPAIAVFIASFISDTAHKIRYKHSFRFISLILIGYLMTVSTIYQAPPLKAKFVTYKDIKSRYFPVDKAMEWVRDNVKNGEKILILRVASSLFYRDKYDIKKKKIVDFWYDLSELSTSRKLKIFCKENDITYIMFSYGEAFPVDNRAKILEYLKENPEGEFMEIVKFNLDENYIFIYKIKPS